MKRIGEKLNKGTKKQIFNKNGYTEVNDFHFRKENAEIKRIMRCGINYWFLFIDGEPWHARNEPYSLIQLELRKTPKTETAKTLFLKRKEFYSKQGKWIRLHNEMDRLGWKRETCKRLSRIFNGKIELLLKQQIESKGSLVWVYFIDGEKKGWVHWLSDFFLGDEGGFHAFKDERG